MGNLWKKEPAISKARKRPSFQIAIATRIVTTVVIEMMLPTSVLEEQQIRSCKPLQAGRTTKCETLPLLLPIPIPQPHNDGENGKSSPLAILFLWTDTIRCLSLSVPPTRNSSRRLLLGSHHQPRRRKTLFGSVFLILVRIPGTIQRCVGKYDENYAER